MRIEPYRRVLALPGVRSLMLVALLARIPVTAVGVTLTLHVVLDLRRGYAAAGLVGAAATVGMALGAPLLGRFVDRYGLRPVVATTTLAEVVFWASAPALPYPVLLALALPFGLLALPVFSVVRQSLAALVPEDARRPAYSIDSMSVELSYMTGPALAVLIVTQASASVALWALALAMLLSGLGLYGLDPPTRGAAEPRDEAPVARRVWLRPRLVGVLVIATATTVVLGGTDVAVVAVLRAAGEVQWTGVVLGAWGVYSMLGGFVHGAIRKPLPSGLLILLLAIFTVPVGLAHAWWLVALAMIPAGVLCAPTLVTTADAVSRLVPASARGEAMGWYGSALTAGMAIGAPLAGAVVDLAGAPWGFAAAGFAGLVVAAGAGLIQRPGLIPRRGRRTPAAPGLIGRAGTGTPVVETPVVETPVVQSPVGGAPERASGDAGTAHGYVCVRG
jgi:MFS family permease